MVRTSEARALTGGQHAEGLSGRMGTHKVVSFLPIFPIVWQFNSHIWDYSPSGISGIALAAINGPCFLLGRGAPAEVNPFY